MSKTNKCAYCDEENKFTKEHIFPKFLYKENPNRKLGYNVAANKYEFSEGQIKDVCQQCNNKKLSDLDNYGQEFYSANGLSNFYHSKTDIVYMRYNYNLLLRFLLKISYNGARLKSEDIEWMFGLRKFILTGNINSHDNKINLFLEIVRSHKILEDERPNLPKATRNDKYVKPDMLRVGTGLLSVKFDVDFLLRLVSINAYYFYILTFHKSIKLRDTIMVEDALVRAMKGAKKIDPRSNSLKIFVSPRDFYEVVEFQVKLRHPKWEDFIKKGKL